MSPRPPFGESAEERARRRERQAELRRQAAPQPPPPITSPYDDAAIAAVLACVDHTAKTGLQIVTELVERQEIAPDLAKACFVRAVDLRRIDSDALGGPVEEILWLPSGSRRLEKVWRAEEEREALARARELKARLDDRRRRLRLVGADEIEARPVDWVIPGILAADSLAVLWGLPGTFKSLIAQSWAYDLSHEGAASLYVAGEGGSGIGRRRNAYLRYRRLRRSCVSRTHMRLSAIDLLDPALVAYWADALADLNLRLVVIDTLARCIAGGDENGTAMGQAVDAADRLRRATGACVLLIHHPTKDGSTSRGHSALAGAVDTELRATRKGAVTTITAKKQRDGEDGVVVGRYKLAPVDGTGSCTVVAISDDEQLVEDGSTKVVEAFVASESGILSILEVAEAIGVSRPTAHGLIDGLITAGLVRKAGKRGRANLYALDRPGLAVPPTVGRTAGSAESEVSGMDTDVAL